MISKIKIEWASTFLNYRRLLVYSQLKLMLFIKQINHIIIFKLNKLPHHYQWLFERPHCKHLSKKWTHPTHSEIDIWNIYPFMSHVSSLTHWDIRERESGHISLWSHYTSIIYSNQYIILIWNFHTIH